MTGAHPLAADLDHLAAAERLVEDPSAHPVAGLEHDDPLAGVDEAARGGEAREPRADHDDVDGPGCSRPGARRHGAGQRGGGGRSGGPADQRAPGERPLARGAHSARSTSAAARSPERTAPSM